MIGSAELGCYTEEKQAEFRFLNPWLLLTSTAMITHNHLPIYCIQTGKLVVHCLRVDTYKKGRVPRLIWDITMQGFACIHAQLIQSYPTTLWTVAHQAPLSMGFSKQEYSNGLTWPPLGDFIDPGIKPASPESSTLQVNSLPAEQPGKPIYHYYMFATSCRERTCLCSPKDLLYVQAIISLNIYLSINLSKKYIF